MKGIRVLAWALIFTAVFNICVLADSNGAYRYFDEVKQKVQSEYRFDTDDAAMYRKALEEVLNNHPEVLDDAFKGMMSTLDKYSTYFSPEDYRAWNDSLSGVFAGIGVTVRLRSGYVLIESVIDNSPAQAAGIKSGDVIVSVDNKDAYGVGIAEVRKMILGAPGTAVKVGVKRQDSKDIIYYTMKRAIVDAPTVTYKVVEGEKIGYIYISDFASNTPRLMEKALSDFDSKGIKKIILDLRDNPGGIRDVAVKLAGMLVPKGPVMYIQYKDSSKDEVFYSDNTNPKYTLAVLVNRNSASASELLAGTIKDTKTGVIVGETTYGKGTMQTLINLWNGGAIKYTVATYLTAGKTPVNEIGVKPDYPVKNVVNKLKDDSRFEPMAFLPEINASSPGSAVKALEQRLDILGYQVGGKPDERFDDGTSAAIKVFQEENKMTVTGKADIMTQIALDNATYDLDVVNDLQYEKALEILKSK